MNIIKEFIKKYNYQVSKLKCCGNCNYVVCYWDKGFECRFYKCGLMSSSNDIWVLSTRGGAINVNMLGVCDKYKKFKKKIKE